MKMPDTIGVLIPTSTVVNGRSLTSYHPDTPDRIINGDFQPLKYNAMYKPYGITDTTSNILFCKDFNLDASMHFLINGSQYKVDSIQKWKKHVEMYLSKVVGT